MYGGVIYNSSDLHLPQNSYRETTNELWSYNLITNKWSLLNFATNDTFPSNSDTSKMIYNETIDDKNYILPIGVSGHSIYIVERPHGKSILIFFGYSEYYASNLNLIQEYVIGMKIKILV